MSESVVCGLIGSGITASLTPSMHEREGARQGLVYAYRIVDTDAFGPAPLDASGLRRLVLAARDLGFRGLNITHPYKQAVLEMLDDLSPDARTLGAVNTVHFDRGAAVGHNTDCSGFAASLVRGLPTADLASVAQIGAGGAGSAVAYAALAAGARTLTIVDTDAARSGGLVNTLRASFPDRRVVAGTVRDVPRIVSEATGLINATPIGMLAHPGLPVPIEVLRSDLWVADVIYRPAVTELIAAARDLGAPILAGTGMAVYQAVDAFRIFTGREPDVDAMTAHMGEMLESERAVGAGR